MLTACEKRPVLVAKKHQEMVRLPEKKKQFWSPQQCHGIILPPIKKRWLWMLIKHLEQVEYFCEFYLLGTQTLCHHIKIC